MPDIQTTDVGRKLQRRYQLLGAPPSPFLSPELVPVVLVDDLTNLDILEATFERPCEAAIVTSAVIGQAANHAIVNPTDSGVIATIESVFTRPTGNGIIAELQMVSGLTANAFTRRAFRDSRISGTPTCGMLQTTVAAVTPANYQWLTTDATTVKPVFVPLGWVISPGFSLRLRLNTDNVALTTSWKWTERLIEAG